MTEKQKRFCDEYLIDLNATQAAIRAGYSKRTAAVIGVENLKKPNIKKYIDEHILQSHSKAVIDRQERMVILSNIAMSDEEKATSRISAIDTLNKMDGEYVTKLEIARPIDDTVKEMEEYFAKTRTDTPDAEI